VKLASTLVGTIRTEWRRWKLLPDWNNAAVTVHSSCRRINDGNFPSASELPCLIKDVDRAGEIYLMCPPPFAAGTRDRRNGRQVKAGIYAIERLFHRRGIGDIPIYELYVVRQILTVPARKVVEHPDRMAFQQQRIYEMRTHEPGPAGHKNASHPQSSKGKAPGGA